MADAAAPAPPLAALLQPCGPVLDAKYAGRVREMLADPAAEQGWTDALARAWPALASVFGASPYLAGLARGRPERLARILGASPAAGLEAILSETSDAGAATDTDIAGPTLRRLKGDLHLLTALCDVGGVWPLETVVEALSDFADAAVQSALAVVAAEERAKGRLKPVDGGPGPVPGLFVLAMGKHGGRELNYSSDIDITFFFEPDDLPLTDGVEPQAFAARIAQGVSRLLSDRTADGYVFRVDLRLRPDPAATPPAVSAPAAFEYYQAVGQNWERAAFIKARPCAGDIALADAFLKELTPFVWRRNLDFAAISDVHSIKRQIHVHKTDERLTAPGADLKLGAGGIREIEFFVQTQQLILGGRDKALRSPRTLEALAALAAAGHVKAKVRADLTKAYIELRGLEHRVQMINDEQTHRLPEDAGERRRVAALAGGDAVRAFDARVSTILKTVNKRYGELFAGEEALSSRFGSLVFTGVEDDPETLRTLARMGFSNPAQVSADIRAWHHGRIPATRPERGRELLTRLAPRLLDAAQATGAPDEAFGRFAAFFSGLTAGIQVQSLFLAQPDLLDLLVRILAFAPRLARTLARRPGALDSLFDTAFFAGFEEGKGEVAVIAAAEAAPGFEAKMDALRRAHAEQSFRIGVQVMSGQATAAEAGPAYADLADICVRALAPAALEEVIRVGGAFEGDTAVVALGKFGGREMTARSDLDLMTLYAAAPGAVSETKGWTADMVYARFTQRLIAALSAPTAEGELYEIDMRLRPSGSKGPVAVHLPAFEAYYGGEAETWELMALTRARVIWASSPAFAQRVSTTIDQALRRPRDLARATADAVEMRQLMAAEREAKGAWDLKLTPGGLVDVEFAAQLLQLRAAAHGAPLSPNTGAALISLLATGEVSGGVADPLIDGWRLQQNLSQLLSLALEPGDDPAHEPAAFQRMLAKAGGERSFSALLKALARRQTAAREAWSSVAGHPATDFGAAAR